VGRLAFSGQKPHSYPNSTIGYDPPITNVRAVGLPRAKHEYQVPSFWRTSKPAQNSANSLKIKKVSYHFLPNFVSYTEAKRIQATVSMLEQKEEAKFMKERQEKVVT